jgi:predicted O-methyltransferase YrrM
MTDTIARKMKYFSDISWLWRNKEGGFFRRATVRLDPCEGALLWKYCKVTTGGILELGRFHGGSTVLLLEGTSHTDRKVTSVDMNPAQMKKECKKIFNQHENRLNLITSKTQHAKIDHDYDLLFIDAGHCYDDVKTDTETHWKKLKPQGFVVYHDHTGPDWPTAPPKNGVKEFCDEWVEQGRMKKIESARSMIVFQKMNNSKLCDSILFC